MSNKNKSGFSSAISFFIIMFILGTFVYSKGEKNEKKEEIRQYDFSTISYEGLDENILNTMQNELNIEITDDNKDDLYLFNSVYNNSNLNQEQKNLFYGYYSVVNDIVNLNKNSAYMSLENVSINYVDRGSDVLDNTLGDYDYRTGKINIYTEYDKDNRVLLHEGVHCLFYNQNTVGLPRAFTEGMTELITNEYFSKDPFYEDNTYPLEISYVKMLCEVVGEEKVLDAYISGDYSLIYREMDKYNKSDISSYKILDIYEDSLNNIDSLGESKYSSTDRATAYNTMKDIYNMKEDKSNSKEFNYLHELSGACFEEAATDFFSQYLFYYGVLEKAYVSHSLKQLFPNPINVKFDDRNKVLIKSKD